MPAYPDEQMGATTMGTSKCRVILLHAHTYIYIYIYPMRRLWFAALAPGSQPLPPPAFPVCAPATL